MDALLRTIPLFPRRPAGSLGDCLYDDWRFEVGATLGDLDLGVYPNVCSDEGDLEFFLGIYGPSVERYFDLKREQDGSLTGNVGGFRALVLTLDEWSNPSHVLVLLEERLLERPRPLDWEILRWRLENEPGGEVGSSQLFPW